MTLPISSRLPPSMFTLLYQISGTLVLFDWVCGSFSVDTPGRRAHHSQTEFEHHTRTFTLSALRGGHVQHACRWRGAMRRYACSRCRRVSKV